MWKEVRSSARLSWFSLPLLSSYAPHADYSACFCSSPVSPPAVASPYGVSLSPVVCIYKYTVHVMKITQNLIWLNQQNYKIRVQCRVQLIYFSNMATVARKGTFRHICQTSTLVCKYKKTASVFWKLCFRDLKLCKFANCIFKSDSTGSTISKWRICQKAFFTWQRPYNNSLFPFDLKNSNIFLHRKIT